MQNRFNHFRTLALMLASLMLGAVGGALWERGAQVAFAQPPTGTANQGIDLRLISEAWDRINQSYVDRTAVQPDQLTYAAIRGMTDALGDTGHSRFLTPALVKQRSATMRGQSEGIGVKSETKNGHIILLAPLDGSPAQTAGLKPGDFLLAVDGVKVDGWSTAQVDAQMLGPAGTSVRLTIQDPATGAAREVTVVRAQLTISNVTWAMIPETQIAEIRIAHFSRGVAQALQKALGDAKAQGARAIILDLRNDPGGSLPEAIGVASQFLQAGDVLEERNAQGVTSEIPVRPGGAAPEMPMVVLVNRGTASASEIVTAALQDAHRAQVVGSTTFGTGTVLHQFALPDGSALLLATREWLTPNGRSIWHKGLVPDVPVAEPSGAEPVIPEALTLMTPTDLKASADLQLFKGMELLGQPLPRSP